MEFPQSGSGTATWGDSGLITTYVASPIKVLKLFPLTFIWGTWENSATYFTGCFICTCKGRWGTQLATHCEIILKSPTMILPASITPEPASFKILSFPQTVSAQPGISKKTLSGIESEKGNVLPGPVEALNSHLGIGDLSP